MTINIDDIPEEVEHIIGTLQMAGHDAYMVGGCVRDLLLGRRPHDYDIVTSAVPGDVQRVFAKCGIRTIPTGEKYGTISIYIDAPEGYYGKIFEVTTMRADGDYSDGRRPDTVRFTKNLEKDLSRRDFTINAMAYDPYTEELIDPFHGQKDLELEMIYPVGLAKERFAEDALRMMRAIRFAAQLGFIISTEIISAIGELAPTLVNVSKERIREELMKLLGGVNAGRALDYLFVTNLAEQFLPKELVDGYDFIKGEQDNDYHIFTVTCHCISAMEEIPPTKPLLRLAAFLHDVGKLPCKKWNPKKERHQFINHEHVGAEIAEKWMREMKFSNAAIKYVSHLILHHMRAHQPLRKHSSLLKFIVRVGKAYVRDWFMLRRADIKAQNPKYVPEGLERTNQLELQIMSLMPVIIERTSELPITGQDVMDILKVEPGEVVGAVLDQVKEAINSKPYERNNREYALSYIRSWRPKANKRKRTSFLSETILEAQAKLLTEQELRGK